MAWAFEWKNSRGYRYLCLVQKKRTEKGPRNVKQLYVGTAKTLFEKLQGPPSTPLRSFPLGKMAGLYHAATETGLLEAFARNVPRSLFDGYAVENMLFLQLAARVDRPLSREEMAQWVSRSALNLIAPSVGHPSSRTLRRYLKRLFGVGEGPERGKGILSRAVSHRIEEHVFKTLLGKGIEPSWLLFDTTNFFAYHEAGRFFQRGHSKEKRYDKNLVGLGLVTLGNLPVLTEVYRGNEGDAQVFARVFDGLVKRLIDLEVATEKLVMVFDRGINSKENFARVLDGMHVIAALNRQQARKLFRVPLEKFHTVAKDSEGKPVLGFSTRWSGFEQDWRVLVTYRKATAEYEEKTWRDVRARVLSRAEEWSQSPSAQEKALWRKLSQLVPKGFQVAFEVKVEAVPVVRKGKPATGYVPRVKVLPQEEARLRASFGKTAVITDLPVEELTDEKVVEGFVARAQVEEDFKWLKDRHVVSVKPFYLWHDATVPGHVFLCVMGLLLLRYLQWELRELQLSMKQVVEILERIRVVLVRGADGTPKLVMEQMEREEALVFSKLNLGRFIPAGD
jgi:transposase